MTATGPPPDYPACLLRQEDELQAEAKLVLTELDLATHLAPIGDVLAIGSAATGLLVWRDLDFNVVSVGLSVDRLLDVIRPFFRHPRVSHVRFLNETMDFNPTGLPRDERYFIAMNYALPDGAGWKVDISFWLHGLPRDELEYVQRIRRQLTPEKRLAILWIKDLWHIRPGYRSEVSSMDIYDAVLEHGVRTPEEFERHRQAFRQRTDRVVGQVPLPAPSRATPAEQGPSLPPSAQ